MIPTIVLLSAFLVWTSEVLSPKEEKKTPEQELKEAIAKYLTEQKSEK